MTIPSVCFSSCGIQATTRILWVFLFPSLRWELRDGQFDFPCAYTRDRNGSCVAPISVFLELKGRDICACLLYNYNSFSLRRTNKHPSSGPNLPLNLFFTEFMFFITLSRHSQKHNFSIFSSKIYSWTSLQFIFSPLNFFHRPVFRPVPRTLGDSHRVSNSHLTFSSVTYISTKTYIFFRKVGE